MTWNEAAGSIVTGAIGIGVGIMIAGKMVKDLGSISSGEPEEKSSKLKPKWRL